MELVSRISGDSGKRGEADFVPVVGPVPAKGTCGGRATSRCGGSEERQRGNDGARCLGLFQRIGYCALARIDYDDPGGPTFALVHAASGLALATDFKSVEAADAAMTYAAPLIDWMEPVANLKGLPEQDFPTWDQGI